MSYAERISVAEPSKGYLARLLVLIRQTIRPAGTDRRPANEEAHVAINPDTGVDIAATRQFSEYRKPADVSHGSSVRLHGIADSISSMMPR